MQYKIGDVIPPKYYHHKDWPDRLIVGFDSDKYGNKGYLWLYADKSLNDNELKTSLNHNDTLLNTYWKLKDK